MASVPRDPSVARVSRYRDALVGSRKLSLALGRGAIASVHRPAAPKPGGGVGWERDSGEAITRSDEAVSDLTRKPNKLGQFRGPQPGLQRIGVSAAAVLALGEQLPLDLQCRFSDAVAISVDADPVRWARLDPSTVLAALDDEELVPA